MKNEPPTFLLYDMDRTENDASDNSSIVASVFVAAVTFLLSRCLSTIGEHIQTHRLVGGIMKYAVGLDSGVMIYIPSFMKIGSGIQKLIERDTLTHRQHGDRIHRLLFFQNKEIRLKENSGQRSHTHTQN
jgi:hypothetical protein